MENEVKNAKPKTFSNTHMAETYSYKSRNAFALSIIAIKKVYIT
jgi:hypothetical protein